jgi:serine/threonine protein kinase
MGVVYLGEDPQTKQKVALKVLLQQNRKDKSTALIEEALTARRIDHPNCVAVYGVFDGPSETPVVVSEFVDGIDAREFLDLSVFRQCPGDPQSFSPLSSLLIIEQMFRGLRAAHKIGITHQDIKPQNYIVAGWMVREIEELVTNSEALLDDEFEALLLRHRGEAWIKLCDWGLALFQNKRPVDQGSISITHTRIQDDKRGGTLVYMPLEQIEGVGVSRRTDIFPLGLILYELLSGRPALEARCHSEGMTKTSIGDYFQFLMKVAASNIRSVVISRTDPLLAHIRDRRTLMRLLENMTARRKQHRISSQDLEVKLELYIIRLIKDSNGLKGVSPGWSVFLGLIIIISLGSLFYVNQPESLRMVPKSVDRAMRLGKYEALPKLLQIDPQLAQVLVDSGLPALNFDSLLELDLKSAAVLATFKGTRLSFGSLRFLDPEVALLLSQSQVSELLFDGLERLELPVGGSLPQFKGDVLSFGGLKTIEYSEAVVMSALSVHTLRLNGLETLRPDYLRELIRFEGRAMELNGLERLEQETAKVLATYKGEVIHLRSLKYLDVDLVGTLSNFRGVIYLDGLEYASNGSLRTLQQNPQTFKVSDSISKRFIRLNRTNGMLSQLKITPLVARQLVEGGYPQLVFSNLRTLDVESAEELSKYRGSGLHLHRVGLVGAGVLKELVKCRVDLLCFKGLIRVDREAARALAEFPRRQLIVGVRTMEPTVAREFLNFKGSVLRFDGLLRVKPSVLKELTAYKGTHIYFGVRTLTPFLAKIAAQSRVTDSLGFDGLKTLDVETAAELVKFNGAKLSLQGLRSVSPKLRAVLVTFPGDVYIAGHRRLGKR